MRTLSLTVGILRVNSQWRVYVCDPKWEKLPRGGGPSYTVCRPLVPRLRPALILQRITWGWEVTDSVLCVVDQKLGQ